MEGYIFDIQSFSVHDGPGCRTSVFFSGCPLHCKWCSNPESHTMEEHLLFKRNLCKWKSGCRACEGVCPKGSITFDPQSNGVSIDFDKCRTCDTFSCVSHCPNGVFVQCVKKYSVTELISILKRDAHNWGDSGGVTFTGGEPLLQHSFLQSVLEECKKAYIHTAIETSANVDESVFLTILKEIDFAFIDVKNMDSNAHRQGTGCGNERILSNIRALASSNYKGRIVLRQPTIKGFNSSKQNAMEVIRFMKETGLYEINLLKFHRFGASKWEQMGKDFGYLNSGDISNNELYELSNLYLDNDIACYVGNDTPF